MLFKMVFEKKKKIYFGTLKKVLFILYFFLFFEIKSTKNQICFLIFVIFENKKHQNKNNFKLQ